MGFAVHLPKLLAFLEDVRRFLQDPRERRRIQLTLALFAAAWLSDTASLLVAQLIPDPPPIPEPRFEFRPHPVKPRIETYSAIITRDLFSSAGTIAEDDFTSGAARRTRLRLRLVGTMVFDDPQKSMATIEETSLSKIYPVQEGDSIPSRAQITKIEEFKVYFVNLSTQELEFVDLAEKPTESFERFQAFPLSGVQKKASDSGITQIDSAHYNVARNTLDQAVGNLGEVLKEAHAVPHFENGRLDGYQLTEVVRGSIYEKLGIKENDVITTFNGNSALDQAKAFQALGDLKNTNEMDITIKRGGVVMPLHYTVR